MPSITRRRPGDAGRRASVDGQILATTRRLLTEGANFTELGVQRIATEAGVARSTFYAHFRDKSELLIRLAETVEQAAFEVVGAWRPDNPRGVESLADAYAEVIRVYRENAAVLTAINEVATYDDVVRGFWSERLDRFVARGAESVIAEQAAGRTPVEVDPLIATRLNVIGGDRFIAHHIVVDDGSGDAAAARELAAIWWYAVLRRPGVI